jgi:glycerate-2-kinase
MIRSNGTNNNVKRAEVWVDDEDEVKALKTVEAIASQKPLSADESSKATKALFEKLVGVRRKVHLFLIFTSDFL